MSEFNPTAGAKMEPIAAPRIQQHTQSWHQRPLVLGLSLPWLLGAVLLIGGAGWYLFGPEQKPSINRLAFPDAEGLEPVTAAPAARQTNAFEEPSPELPQFKEQVASMIGDVRSYAEANRTAIGRLSQTVKSQGAALTQLQQLLAEAQAQNTALTARLSTLEQRPAYAPVITAKPAATKAGRSSGPSLASLHLEAVQNGMAWVSWQDKTWAVKTGDSVGGITVTGIDARAREVMTSAGTLK